MGMLGHRRGRGEFGGQCTSESSRAGTATPQQSHCCSWNPERLPVFASFHFKGREGGGRGKEQDAQMMQFQKDFVGQRGG